MQVLVLLLLSTGLCLGKKRIPTTVKPAPRTTIVSSAEARLASRQLDDEQTAFLSTNSSNGISDIGLARDQTTERIVQLVESEVFDGKVWKAPGGAKKSTSLRWTDLETGEVAPSPTEYFDGEYEWTSDWKIVTSAHRDEFGWEYDYKQRRNQQQSGLSSAPIRRRIWLRTHKEEPPALSPSSSSTAGTGDRKRKGKRRRKGPVKEALELITEDFNFKGFGVTVYKSLVFLKSAGIALRLPILTNFNWWESHPSLPSVASSVAYYTPGTFAIFLNASIRYEWLQWVVHNACATFAYAGVWLLWTLLLRGLITAISALAFPVTRRLLLDPQLPVQPPNWKIPPSFSRVFEERLGCSWSWRVSVDRGYEYRVSYWHYFAPSVAALLGGWKGTPDFLVRHAAAFGMSTSGPIPDEPYLTSSVLFALSGFHLKNVQAKDDRSVPFTTTTAKKDDETTANEDEDAPVEGTGDAPPPNASKLLRL
jgi:hypothetical protein